MKDLCGCSPDERHPAGTDGLAVVAPLEPFGAHVYDTQTVRAQGQFILFIHRAATVATDKCTGSFRIIRIDSVTAYPAPEDPDVLVAVIDHAAGAALRSYHSPTSLGPVSAKMISLSESTRRTGCTGHSLPRFW